MDADALCFQPAGALARLIASRQVSSVEVVDAVLDRATRLNPVLNIFAHKMFDSAREQARAAEAAVMTGAALGPLHGVPITVKDNVPIAGLPMANGSLTSGGFVPEADAAVVARVRAAGAIIIGKTNLPEFAHKVLTDSPLFGVTRNPWSLEHTPGGSSGGASAALAAGVAPLAIGTDGGGSIRCPASCAGVLGIKATLGRIPFEAIPDAFANFAFIGPMARTVGDLALLLSVMSGPDLADPYSIAVPAETFRPVASARGLRIGWIEDFGQYRTEAETARLTRAAVMSLQAEGAEVEALRDSCFDDLFATYVVLATTAHAARLGLLVEAWGDRLTESIRASIRRGQGWSAVDWQRANDRRTALFRSVQGLFARYDLIATPTMTAPPTGLDAGGSIETTMYAEWAAPLYPFNMTGHPAASVPAGFTAAGLPVGLQLIAPWFAEQRILDVAAVLERMHRWPEQWPRV